MGFPSPKLTRETSPFSHIISGMKSFRRAHYSCSSSCSSSPTDSPLPPDPGDDARAAGLTVMGDRLQSFTERRRLTRSRKLRHATDDELGLGQLRSLGQSQSTPVSPESTPKSRCPPHQWWSTAVPLPLPLPEAVSCRGTVSSPGRANLVSPSTEGPTSEFNG